MKTTPSRPVIVKSPGLKWPNSSFPDGWTWASSTVDSQVIVARYPAQYTGVMPQSPESVYPASRHTSPFRVLAEPSSIAQDHEASVEPSSLTRFIGHFTTKLVVLQWPVPEYCPSATWYSLRSWTCVGRPSHTLMYMLNQIITLFLNQLQIRPILPD
jgi:hypothetical protein